MKFKYLFLNIDKMLKMQELIRQEIHENVETKYKYYKLSRSRSNNILKEQPWDVYVKGELDSKAPERIGANDYSLEWKFSNTPLVFSDKSYNSCKNIETITDIVNGIIKNIRAYAKENKYMELILYTQVDNDTIGITTYTVKKVRVIKKELIIENDDEQNDEEETNETIINIYETDEEIPEDTKPYNILADYIGYAIIENEQNPELKRIVKYDRSLGSLDEGGTIISVIANLIAECYEAYDNKIIKKFSVLFETDENSYFDKNDELITKIDKTYTHTKNQFL